MKLFKDRKEAGQRLADRLQEISFENPLVLALPRGGVPLAVEIAARLAAPMDLMMVKKIGLPSQEELAIGAISEDGVVVYNKRVLKLVNLSREMLEIATEEAHKILQRKAEKFRQYQRPYEVEGKDIIVVDDGLATGQTVMAVLKLLKKRKARKIVVAAPVAPVETVAKIKKLCDEVIVLVAAEYFYAVGEFYENFSEVTDEDVIACLRERRSVLNGHPPEAIPQEHSY